ncbi:hypothetical protein SteCoe_35164 [Stentor coeruleus]|uniref:Uncharacterized protein n=1 Tax=Stentor coeruleus TaxID=5963 RepID=A0A1R2AT26_9CILI|nr:hypothetical protein SteCoe_35164 [Stentor coeruleus]
MSNAIKLGYLPVNLKKDLLFHQDKPRIITRPSIDNLKAKNQIIPKRKYFSTSPIISKLSSSVKELESIYNRQKNSYSTKISDTINNQPKKKTNSLSIHSVEETINPDIKTKNLDKMHDLMRDIESQEDKQKRFNLSENLFQSILNTEIEYIPMLKVLKHEYEKVIRCQYSLLKQQASDLKNMERIKNLLSSEIIKLVSNNRVLIQKLEETEKKYADFDFTMDFDLNNIEYSEENWLKIIHYTKSCKENLEKVSQEAQYYKAKATKMMELLIVCERKGYPLDEIYRKEVKRRTVIPIRCEFEDVPDDTDNEDIVTGKKDYCRKAGNVPELTLPNSHNDSLEEDLIHELRDIKERQEG